MTNIRLFLLVCKTCGLQGVVHIMWFPSQVFILSCGNCGANEKVDVSQDIMPNEVAELAQVAAKQRKEKEIGKN